MSKAHGMPRAGAAMRVWPYLVLAVSSWTLAVGCILWWAIIDAKEHHLDMARAEALERCERFALFLDPAFMAKDIHEMQQRENGRWGRIAALNPRNPANAPDPWEAERLRAFEGGAPSLGSIEIQGGQSYFRYMTPVRAKEECLACHANQGYAKDSLMGGIGVSIPLEPYLASWRRQSSSIAFRCAVLWLAGLLGIGITGRNLRQRIAENERAHQALQESEARFATIASAAQDALLMMGPDERIVFCNRAAETIFGWSAKEMMGQDLHRLLVPERYRDAYKRGIGYFKETGEGAAIGKTLEMTALRKDGSEFPIELSLSGVQFAGEWHAVGIVHDITQRKEAEKNLRMIYLRESAINEILGLSLVGQSIEEVLQQALELLVRLPVLSLKEKGAIFLVDKGTDTLVLSAQHGLAAPLLNACARVRFGWCLCGRAAARGEVQFADCVDERHITTYEGMQPHGHCCVPMNDGNHLVGVLNLYLEEGAPRDERLERFLLAVADALAGIVVRHEMGEIVRQSEERYRTLFQSSQDAIMTLEPPTWQFTSGNPACIAMFGAKDEGDFTSYGPWAVSPERQPDGRPSGEKAKEAIETAMREGSYFFEWTHQRLGGQEFPATVLLTRLAIGDHMFLQATVRDISRQKQMETELTQAQKLESVGRLAAGIAHEINTPTQYVGDNIEFLQIAFENLAELGRALPEFVEAGREGPIPPPLLSKAQELIENVNLGYLAEQVPRAIEQSLEGIGRISTIVQAMKEFSHPGVAEKTTVDLNQCIRSTAMVSRNEWKYVADIDLDLDEGLPRVLCLPGDFNQAVLNMIVNAAHAIGGVVGDGAEGKGKITVSTRQEDSWAVVRIADNGSGIPEAIRERIFDPFFTTKEVGRGTGQGLAIARNVVVDKHGGTLSVESEPGKGTVFTIRLPIGGQNRMSGGQEE